MAGAVTESANLAAASAPVIAHGLFSYQIGGSERVGADISIELKRRGYELVCFAFYDHDGPVREELEAAGIRCVNLNYTARSRPWRRVTYQIEFFRFLRQHAVDSLIVHHATALILCGLPSRAAKLRRVLMIEHALHQLREKPGYRQSAKRYCRFADVITGVDQEIVDYFKDEMKVDAAKLRYLPNGVRLRPHDSAVRSSARSALGLDADDFVFLFVGRLHPVKDVPTLLLATSMLSQDVRSRVRVLLAGDGSEREALQRQASELQLGDSVRFLGARGDVPQLLQAADAFIMTSVTEGQPMALIEAMAAGLPCIATAVGGIPALLSDGTGLLVRSATPSDVAVAMSRFMSDPDLRASCAVSGIKRVQKAHSLERVVDAYLTELRLPMTFS